MSTTSGISGTVSGWPFFVSGIVQVPAARFSWA